MSAQYNVGEWAAATKRGRQVFNYAYSPSGTEFKSWTLIKVVTLQDARDVTEKAYIWQGPGGLNQEMVRIDITERHTWRLAQESLRAYLLQCMRPDIPRGTRALAQLGDVVYVGREAQSDVPGAISFSRGNVCIVVTSAGQKHVDVSDMAAGLDRALGEPPARGELVRGEVRARTPREATVQANEARVLIENLRKAAPRGGWLKVIVPDGELSRKGDALIYVAAEGGKKLVSTFAISRK